MKQNVLYVQQLGALYWDKFWALFVLLVLLIAALLYYILL